MANMSRYSIYPSLLDKFQDLLHYDMVAEQPWNKVSESALAKGLYPGKEVGDYILSPDEMAEKIEVELINSINRCPKQPMEAADAGTCFNEVVDCLIKRKNTERTDMTIRTLRRDDGTPFAIEAKMNGFTFYYNVSLCRDLAAYFHDAISQYLVQAGLDTRYGEVTLYGYIDEWIGNRIYDIKTTSMYDFGKFADKTQKLVYPFCAVESGMVDSITEFEYTIVKWKKNNKDVIYTTRLCSDGVDNMNDYEVQQPVYIDVWSADCFREVYTYNHEDARRMLQLLCERFIEWLEYRKKYITDKKIFGGENPDGYVGKEIEKIIGYEHN